MNKVCIAVLTLILQNFAFAYEFKSVYDFDSKKAPGIGILVIKNGKTILKKGLGMANLDKNQKITNDTMFESASVAKIFTAFAVLQLQKDEKLNINDSAKQYLGKDLQFIPRKIRIRNLLYHTSGIPDYLNDKSLNLPKKIANKDYIDDNFVFDYIKTRGIKGNDIDKVFVYSNSNYVLLAKIIEIASNMPYREYMQKHVFEKRDMKAIINHRGMKIKENESVPYGEWPNFEIKNGKYYYVTNGDFGVHISINDFEKWINFIKNDPYYWNLVKSQGYIVNNFGVKIEIPYGFGMRFMPINGFNCLIHRGYIDGASNIFAYSTSLDTFVVVLSNTSSVFADNIAGNIFNEIELDNTIYELQTK